MHRSAPLLVVLASLSACKVVDAPNTLESMMVYGFVHVEDGPEIQAVAEELPGLVEKNLDDLESGYRVDQLRRQDLLDAGVDVGQMEGIVGAMGRVTYASDFDEVLNAISHKHKDTIVDNTTEYEVVEDTDRACFIAGDCPTYQVTADQVTKQAIIGNLTQTFTQDFVWVEHDGRPAIASRVIAPDPVDVSSGLVAVEQQYSFFLVRPLPGGGCERVESMWAEARMLGGDLPDSFLVDTAVNAMGKQAEKVDAWIAGE